MPQMNFTVSPVHTGELQEYMQSESDFISRIVMPEITVPAMTFRYDWRDASQLMRAPENEVGPYDRPPALQFSSEQRASFTKDYGFDVPIANYDEEVAAQQRRAGYSVVNLESTATRGAGHLMRLREEKRVADIYSDPNNFGRVIAIAAAADQWDNPASRPKELIDDIKEQMLVEATHMVISQHGANKLRVHPNLVESVRGARQSNAAQAGRLTIDELSEILEVEVVIGKAKTDVNFEARVDPEAATQNFSVRRLWRNSAALVRLEPSTSSLVNTVMPTFCAAATYPNTDSGSDIAGEISEDPFLGIRGGRWLRVANTRRELITTKYCGALIQNIFDPLADYSVDQSLPDGILQLGRGSL